MDIPWSFKNLCACLNLDSPEHYPTGNAWIEATVEACVDLKSRSELRSFFDDLLNGTLSDSELQKLFYEYNHALRISNGGIRTFLTSVRDALN
jgi:hypothetical protein